MLVPESVVHMAVHHQSVKNVLVLFGVCTLNSSKMKLYMVIALLYEVMQSGCQIEDEEQLNSLPGLEDFR